MKIAEREQELTYQIYMSEIIRLQAENKTLSVKLADIILPQKNRRQKSADEVKKDIFAEFAKLSGGDGDGGRH